MLKSDPNWSNFKWNLFFKLKRKRSDEVVLAISSKLRTVSRPGGRDICASQVFTRLCGQEGHLAAGLHQSRVHQGISPTQGCPPQHGHITRNTRPARGGGSETMDLPTFFPWSQKHIRNSLSFPRPQRKNPRKIATRNSGTLALLSHGREEDVCRWKRWTTVPFRRKIFTGRIVNGFVSKQKNKGPSKGLRRGSRRGSRRALEGLSKGLRRALEGPSKGSRRGFEGLSKGSRRGLDGNESFCESVCLCTFSSPELWLFETGRVVVARVRSGAEKDIPEDTWAMSWREKNSSKIKKTLFSAALLWPNL